MRITQARALGLVLAVAASGAGLCAETIDECPAQAYKPCVTFNTSRTIDEHTPLIENSFAGFVRSDGRWTISVGYGPAEMCAKVWLTVDMGPLDIHRTYERVFRNGKGVISDEGSFLHRTGDVESALRVSTSSCRIPADVNPERLDAKAGDRLAGEERERLALARERERLALAEARERLALEAERARLEQAGRREQLRERERAARERQRAEAERHRARLAALQRGHRRSEVQHAGGAAGAGDTAASLGKGVAAGVGALIRGEAPDVAILRAGTTTLFDLADMSAAADIVSGLNARVGGSFGASCEGAQRRVEAMLAQRTRTAQGMGMCESARYFLRTMQEVRGELARGTCPAHALREYDRTIAQASRNVQASCD